MSLSRRQERKNSDTQITIHTNTHHTVHTCVHYTAHATPLKQQLQPPSLAHPQLQVSTQHLTAEQNTHIHTSNSTQPQPRPPPLTFHLTPKKTRKKKQWHTQTQQESGSQPPNATTQPDLLPPPTESADPCLHHHQAPPSSSIWTLQTATRIFVLKLWVRAFDYGIYHRHLIVILCIV